MLNSQNVIEIKNMMLFGTNMYLCLKCNISLHCQEIEYFLPKEINNGERTFEGILK